jgi:hypothetical protein
LRAPANAWHMLGKPYCTGNEVFGDVTGPEGRQTLWERIPVGHALDLLSGMLRDLDLDVPSTAQVEAGWASPLSGDAAGRARAAVRQGRRLLPPQLLLVAVKEALRHCPAGNARGDLSDLDVVLQAVWSIGDELGQFRDDAEPLWGGVRRGDRMRTGRVPGRRSACGCRPTSTATCGFRQSSFDASALRRWPSIGSLRPPRCRCLSCSRTQRGRTRRSAHGTSTSCARRRSSGCLMARCRSSGSASYSSVPSARCRSLTSASICVDAPGSASAF